MQHFVFCSIKYTIQSFFLRKRQETRYLLKGKDGGLYLLSFIVSQFMIYQFQREAVQTPSNICRKNEMFYNLKN